MITINKDLKNLRLVLATLKKQSEHSLPKDELGVLYMLYKRHQTQDPTNAGLWLEDIKDQHISASYALKVKGLATIGSYLGREMPEDELYISPEGISYVDGIQGGLQDFNSSNPVESYYST